MKTYLLPSALAVLAIACGCSSTPDEPDASAGREEISFSQPFVNNLVLDQHDKATAPQFSQFAVWCYVNRPENVIYQGETVRKQGASWLPVKTEYWFPGNTYYFTAIVPDSRTAGWSYSIGDLRMDIATSHASVDLLYAEANEIEASGGEMPAVPLTFDHVMSQVSFNIANDDASRTYSIRVNSLTLKGVTSQGSFDGESWRTQDTRTDIRFGSMTVGPTTKQATSPAYLLPSSTQGVRIAISFDVVDASGKVAESVSREVDSPVVDMVRGRSYCYELRLDPRNFVSTTGTIPIIFTVIDFGRWEWTKDIYL